MVKKRKPVSEATKRKMSEAHKGKKHPHKGKPHTEEQKRKQSEATKGKQRKPLSEKTKKKISKTLQGRKCTEQTKKKISKTLKGKPGRAHTAKTKRKMSEAQKGKKMSAEACVKMSKARKGITRGPYNDERKQRMSAGCQGIPYEEWEAYACEKKYCPKFNEACKESNREKYGRRCFICGKSEKVNGQKLSVHHVNMDKAQGCESNWKLVPLCKHCHAKAHNDKIISRLGYLLKEESGWLER